jgi:hypothetical protein
LRLQDIDKRWENYSQVRLNFRLKFSKS